MRVALVCPYAWDRDGGVQSHVRSLADTLRARDHEVTVLAPYRSKPPQDDGGPGDVRRVAKAFGVPANGSVAPVAFGPVAAALVRKALGAIDADVMHLHEPLIPSLSLLALWNSKTPSVGTFHAAAEESFGYRIASPILQRAAGRLTIRTAVSDAARELISRYIPGDYALTPNGVDTRRFATAEPLFDRTDRPRVLFLSRIERRKGVEVLIQAMTRLRDLDVELVVGGSGPEERSARALAERLQVPATFLGRVPDEDVPRLYRSADVYCAPGLGGESFGIVLVEAMAAGTPVVCSDLPGFRAVGGGAAELVPPGEAGPLADALRKVLTDPSHAERMRKMSSRMASAYDWSRLVVGVEALYERAAAG